jgi:hypothetical protein
MKKTPFAAVLSLLLSCFLLLFLQLTSGCSSSKSSSASNPVPSVAALSPNSAIVGGSAFTMRVTGTSFISGSKVRWNGSDRTTTYISSTQLDASISAADLAAASTAAVTVFNPSPGGGASSSASFTINNPAPAISSLSPSGTLVGSSALTLTISGSNFVSSSVARWNGADRTTTFISATQLQALIPASNLAMSGTFTVTVFTPPNGGGTSNNITFTVNNPVPAITSLSPGGVAAGSSATVQVSGSNFITASQVYLNGFSRPTSYTSSSSLQVTLSASDLAAAGTSNVTVFNPAPGGGTSDSKTLYVYLSLPVGDIIFDPFTRLIYASVAGSAGAIGNTITEINPATGTIGQSFFIGSEPKKLAISEDGKTLYVALDGAGAVRAFNIPTRTPGLQFSLGSGSGGPNYVEDIKVMPGTSETVAISKMNKCCSPWHEGVAIYDNGIMRPVTTPRTAISNSIEFSGSAATLYGYNNEGSGFEFRRMSVDASGVTVTSVANNLISGFLVDIEFDNGRIYSSSGRIIDPVAMTLLDTIPLPDTANNLNLVRVDSSLGRIFFVTVPITAGAKMLKAFDYNTYTALGSQEIERDSEDWDSFVRWGIDGVAILTSDTPFTQTNKLYVFRSSVVLPPTETGYAPVLTSLGQNATKGGGNFFLTISGANFVRGAAVYLNGAERTTYFVSNNEVRAAIPASDIQTEGSAVITVRNPGTTGTTSNPLTLLIQ